MTRVLPVPHAISITRAPFAHASKQSIWQRLNGGSSSAPSRIEEELPSEASLYRWEVGSDAKIWNVLWNRGTGTWQIGIAARVHCYSAGKRLIMYNILTFDAPKKIRNRSESATLSLSLSLASASLRLSWHDAPLKHLPTRFCTALAIWRSASPACSQLPSKSNPWRRMKSRGNVCQCL